MRKLIKKERQNAKPPVNYLKMNENAMQVLLGAICSMNFGALTSKPFLNISRFSRIVLTPSPTSCSSERAFSAVRNSINTSNV